MASIGAWSVTDNSNTQNTPVGWPEGQAANTVPGCGRAVMGSIARLFLDLKGDLSATGAAATLQVAIGSDWSATSQVGPIVLSTPNTTSSSATLQTTRDTMPAWKIVKNKQNIADTLDDGDIRANQKFLTCANNTESTSAAHAMLTPPHRPNGMTLLASGAMNSAAASVTFGPIPIASAELDIFGALAPSAGTSLWIRLGTVANIRSAAGDYEWAMNMTETGVSPTNTATSSTADTKLVVFNNMRSGVVRDTVFGKIFIHGMNSNGLAPRIEWKLDAETKALNCGFSLGGGGLTSAISCNAIQILMSSGNIDGATAPLNYRLYGMTE